MKTKKLTVREFVHDDAYPDGLRPVDSLSQEEYQAFRKWNGLQMLKTLADCYRSRGYDVHGLRLFDDVKNEWIPVESMT